MRLTKSISLPINVVVLVTPTNHLESFLSFLMPRSHTRAVRIFKSGSPQGSSGEGFPESSWLLTTSSFEPHL